MDHQRSQVVTRTSPIASHFEDLDATLGAYKGWTMPMSFSTAAREQSSVRTNCGIFDVSHMERWIAPLHQKEVVIDALQDLLPIDPARLSQGRQVLSIALNDTAGIVDDLIVGVSNNGVHVISNCGVPGMAERLGTIPHLKRHNDSAMIAIQGPTAAQTLTDALSTLQWTLETPLSTMRFMDVAATRSKTPVTASRSGYTGEDGFEVWGEPSAIGSLVAQLLKHQCAPCGLVSRDVLRLEAGMCLSGIDFDEAVTPIEAGISWLVPKSRREAASRPFLGRAAFLASMQNRPPLTRVSLLSSRGPIVRAGSDLKPEGTLTSCAYSPMLQRTVCMARLPRDLTQPGSVVTTQVRSTTVSLEVTDGPPVAHRFVR